MIAQTYDDAYLDSVSRQFDLDAVVVTGTRTPKFLKDAPIQTRVITSKDIAKLDATNVQDLLQQELPGVEFSYAMNQQTHLNFSGFGLADEGEDLMDLISHSYDSSNNGFSKTRHLNLVGHGTTANCSWFYPKKKINCMT